MEDLKIKGKVTELLEPITGESSKGKWVKNTFIVDNGAEYNNIYAFEMFGDKLAVPRVGDNVTVNFNVRTNQYNGKYYTSLIAWKIEIETQAPKQETPPPDSGDLPF